MILLKPRSSHSFTVPSKNSRAKLLKQKFKSHAMILSYCAQILDSKELLFFNRRWQVTFLWHQFFDRNSQASQSTYKRYQKIFEKTSSVSKHKGIPSGHGRSPDMAQLPINFILPASYELSFMSHHSLVHTCSLFGSDPIHVLSLGTKKLLIDCLFLIRRGAEREPAAVKRKSSSIIVWKEMNGFCCIIWVRL